MRRRAVLKLAGTVVAWPAVVRAQSRAVPTVGILQAGAPGGPNPGVAALLTGLREAGLVEGRDVALEFRYAEGQASRLPALAADLVAQGVAVIAGLGGTAPALAAKAVTKTIPIVFAAPQNPVELGLVESLDRPGGNVTGVVGDHEELTARRLERLHELIPDAATIGLLVNQAVPTAVTSNVNAALAVSKPRGLHLSISMAASEGALADVFAKAAQGPARALVIAADVSFFNWRNVIVALAARHRMPTIYWRRDFVVGGGLASYGANFDDLYRQAGLAIARILNGEKPADLPVLRPTKLEFAINLNTAKALGLDIPPKLRALADEVIE